MASLLARLWSRFRIKKAPLSIMIVGLDNSGKTSILNRLASLNVDGFSSKLPFHHSTPSETGKKDTLNSQGLHGKLEGEPVNFAAKNDSSSNNIMPTIGYNYERIQYKNITLTVLDFSGQNRYRNLWQEFYNGVDAIVFVLDSSDLIRLVVARDELELMLSHPYFNALPSFNNTNNADPSAATATTTGGQPAPNHNSQIMAAAAATVQKQITISQGKLVQSPLIPSSSALVSTVSKQHHSLTGQQANKSNPTHRRRTKVPILFLANKADLASSVDTEVIVKALNLNQLPVSRHPWFIQPTSVHLNQGIAEAFDWLVSQLMVSSLTAT